MKKCNLKTGMTVALNKPKDNCGGAGIVGVIYMDTVFGDVLVYANGTNHERLDLWDEDLIAIGNYNSDITEVYGPADNHKNFNCYMRPTQFSCLTSKDNLKLLWSREPKFKKWDYVRHPDYIGDAFMIKGPSDGGMPNYFDVYPNYLAKSGIRGSNGFIKWKLEDVRNDEPVLFCICEDVTIKTAQEVRRYIKVNGNKYKFVVPYIGQAVDLVGP